LGFGGNFLGAILSHLLWVFYTTWHKVLIWEIFGAHRWCIGCACLKTPVMSTYSHRSPVGVGGGDPPVSQSSNVANIKAIINVLMKHMPKKQAAKGMIVMLLLDGGESRDNFVDKFIEHSVS
tara:strand:+ start:407 stop:772 length:366 start_codon:yes stop_codon:yes gene_type:complete